MPVVVRDFITTPRKTAVKIREHARKRQVVQKGKVYPVQCSVQNSVVNRNDDSLRAHGSWVRAYQRPARVRRVSWETLKP